MRSKTRTILALLLSAAMIICGCGITAFAANSSDSSAKDSVTETDSRDTAKADRKSDSKNASDAKSSDAEDDSDTDDGSDVASAVEEILNHKDESVYVMAAADGTVREIVVSDWIQNNTGSKTVKDKSDLKEVETTKGDTSYTLDSSNSRIWDANGGDVYYKGNSDKDLPVDVSVSYELDGKSITPKKLAGKSGEVKITFNYENNEYQTRTVNGKSEKIYVPFIMLTGMLLDNDTFSNVEVSNGKIINDGDHTAVVGFALPGLAEDLDIDAEDYDIPESVVITADVEDFELSMTATMASNSLFNDLDIDELDQLDELEDSMSELEDAMNQLIDGSSQLYDGLDTLLNSSDTLVSGINALTAGAEQLRDGAGSLEEGAAAVASGAGDLSNGLDTLSGNGEKLLAGAEQIFGALLTTANNELSAADLKVSTLSESNYDEVLNKVIDSLDSTKVYNDALEQVTNGVNAQRSAITEQVTEAVKSNVEESVTGAAREKIEPAVEEQVKAAVTAQVYQTAAGMTEEEYKAAVEAGLVDEETQAAVSEALESQLNSEAVAETIQSKVDEQMSAADIQDEINAKISETMASAEIAAKITEQTEIQVNKIISEKMSSDEVQSKLQAASAGAASVIKLKGSLDSYNAFYLGLKAYVAGVDQCATGASALSDAAVQLHEGTEAIYEGADALYEGLTELKDAMPTMQDGIRQLRDGSMQLSDGLVQFNEEGIQKLVDAVNDNVGGIADRFRATVDAARDYTSYSGIDENMTGSVSFVYKTDGIEKED